MRDNDGYVRAEFLILHDARKYAEEKTAQHAGAADMAPPDATNAAAYVGTAMRGRLDDLRLLESIAASVDGDEFTNDEILRVGVDYGIPGALSVEQMATEAEERLNELPLSVEATTMFEIVLGTGGPDDRLLIECDTSQPHMGGDGPYGEIQYEIRRVLYRYLWSGSREVELVGEDREVAEAFARRVVPELVE